jgi:hypothetical protein
MAVSESARAERRTIVCFHSHNHFFENVHIPAFFEAKPEDVSRFIDDPSAQWNSRFALIDLQDHVAT